MIPAGISSDEYADQIVEMFRHKSPDIDALGQALLFAGVKTLLQVHGPEIIAAYMLGVVRSLEETGDIPRFKSSGDRQAN